MRRRRLTRMAAWSSRQCPMCRVRCRMERTTACPRPAASMVRRPGNLTGPGVLQLGHGLVMWQRTPLTPAAQPGVNRQGKRGPGLQGLVLTCPTAAITLAQAPAEGRLEGLTCFMAGSSQDVVLGATPQKSVRDLVVVPQSLAAGAVFGIIMAVLAGLAALGGVAFLLVKRKVPPTACGCL